MKKLPRIANAEPLIHGVLKISFLDGYEGVIDLRPVLARGKIFTWLQTPGNFNNVRVDDYGHSISWVDGDGYVIDLATDSLRRDAEKQAELHKLMASCVFARRQGKGK